MARISILIIAVFIGVILSCTCCKDNNCPDSMFYRIPYSLSPIKDTFALGDTILVEAEFDEELTDEQGGIKNSFSNYDFRLHLNCGKIDTNPPLSTTLNFIKLNTILGKDSSVYLTPSLSYYTIIPSYISGRYYFKSALVLQVKGLFVLGLTPYESPSYPFEISGLCDHVVVHIGSKLNNDTENNFYMYQWAANPVYHTFDEKRFKDYGGYCFVVK